MLYILFALPYSELQAQREWQYGLGLDIFQTRIHNVDRENFNGYGHSMPGSKQNDRSGFGAAFLAKRKICKGLYFETGAGLSVFRSRFQFDYMHRIAHIPIEVDLNIMLLYVKLPLLLNYEIPLSERSGLNMSLGVNTRLVGFFWDDFQEGLYELVRVAPYKYNFLIVSPQVALGYTHQLSGKKSIRIEAFAGNDLNEFVMDRPMFGFFKNLSTAHYSYYGLGLKYFY